MKLDSGLGLVRALTVPLRIELLLSVWRQPRSVHELARIHGLDDPIVCKHLKALQRLEAVGCRQSGHCKVYFPGSRVTVTDSDSITIITAIAASGTTLHLMLPSAVREEFVPRDLSAPVTVHTARRVSPPLPSAGVHG